MAGTREFGLLRQAAKTNKLTFDVKSCLQKAIDDGFEGYMKTVFDSWMCFNPCLNKYT